jgi:hypothetical protein
MSIVETRAEDRQRNKKMPVTVLPNVKKEQLMRVTLDLKPQGSCRDRQKLLIERGDLVAAKSNARS